MKALLSIVPLFVAVVMAAVSVYAIAATRDLRAMRFHNSMVYSLHR